MKPQKVGVIALTDEKGKLVAIIYKDGPNPPIIYATTPMGDEEIVELMGLSLNQNQTNEM